MSNGQVIRVLLVEDSEPSRELMAMFLASLGVEVTPAAHGAEAVELFGGQAFDLVLTDLSMPVMGGLEALRQMRAHEAEVGREQTPVLVLTASDRDDAIRSCLASGCDGVLHKPVSLGDLAQALSTWTRFER